MGDIPPGRFPEEPSSAPLPEPHNAPPADAAEWRTRFAALPAKDLLRVIQKDKGRAARLLAGFRADGASVRHPIVLARLVEAAQKQPAFAKEVLEAPLPPVPHPSEGKEETAAVPADASPGSDAAEGAVCLTRVLDGNIPFPSEGRETGRRSNDALLKAKLKEHRAALHEKDERLRTLEAALAAAERQRDAALRDAETAKAARTAAEADALRERHRRDREERRHERQDIAAAAKPSQAIPETTAASGAASMAAVSTPLPAHPALFEDAMERLLSRGRHAAVADVCREALTLLEDTAARTDYGRRAEGVVRRLYAEALAAAPDPRQRQKSEEQERLAQAAFLDAGDAGGAAASWARQMARRLAAGASLALKGSDTAPLMRLAALTERTGQTRAVRDAFDQARASAPELTEAIRPLLAAGGRKLAPLLAALPPPSALETRVGQDEEIALPNLPGVTARRIAQAVDSGDARYIRQVRAGLRALRERDAFPLADALESAVAALSSLAVVPLLRKAEPRPIVVDASNVARSNPDPLALSERPRVASLQQMRDYLLRQGWFPVVLIADANLRYHVDDRAAYIRLVERGVVREVPPGSIADAFLIREAEEMEAPLVTNDRLQDWGDAAHHIERYGFVLFPEGAALTPF